MNASRLTIHTNPPIVILVKNSMIEIADSQTFFTDDLIVTVPESLQISLAHGELDGNEEFQPREPAYTA